MNFSLILIFTTFLVEFSCGIIIYRLYKRDPFTNPRIRDIGFGLMIHSILPLSSISEVLPEKYQIIVLLSGKIGTFAGILGISIVVYKIVYHFHEKFLIEPIAKKLNTRADYIYIMLMTLVTVIPTLYLKVEYRSGKWIYNRGPSWIVIMASLGGCVLFAEMLNSFYMVSKSSPPKYRFIFMMYPIAWATALGLFVIQQSFLPNLPVYVYQFPNLVGHILLIIALSLPVSVFLVAPKELTNETLRKLNIKPNSGVILLDSSNNVIYINRNFSNITGYPYHIYGKNFIELFENAEIKFSSEEIYDIKNIILDLQILG